MERRRATVMAALAVVVASVAGCGRATSSDGPPQEPSTSSAPTSPAPTSPAPVSPAPTSATVTATASPAPATPPSTPATSGPLTPTPDLTLPTVPADPIVGGDISWPQCPKGMGIPQKPTLGLPMPSDSAQFVILGLTNGPGFTANPCLASQTQWVRQRGLWAAAYAVSSFPDGAMLARYGDRGPFDGTTRLGALGNVGYQQATFNVRTMRAAGLRTPIVWLDVEPVPLFAWSTDLRANAAVVVGAAHGYQDAGYRIGAYSTQALWGAVVGSLELGLPEWRAAGKTSRAEALRRCGEDRMFQGGPAVIAQWVADDRDLDITCPGTAAAMAVWFHDYR